MHRFTILRVKEYTDETLPSNPDDVELDKPLILEYVDDVPIEHVLHDYLRYFKLPNTTDVLITRVPENNSGERTTNAIIYSAIGKKITQKQLDKLSAVIGHDATYLINKPEYMCEKIIPERFKITKSIHEVGVWIPAH